MTENEKISRIVQIEYRILKAVMNGHKAFIGDEFQKDRDEMIKLRCELYPRNTYCIGQSK